MDQGKMNRIFRECVDVAGFERANSWWDFYHLNDDAEATQLDFHKAMVVLERLKDDHRKQT